MIKAYVLIQAITGKRGSGGQGPHPGEGGDLSGRVTGPYDVVAVAEAASLGALSRRVIGRMQAIEGVIRPLLYTVVRL